MLVQLALGAALICVGIIIEVGFIGAATYILPRISHWMIRGNKIVKFMISLLGVVLWMLAALTIVIWVWAVVFFMLDQFADFETSLYFSTVAFTTLGFGDIVIGTEWRLLSGLMAANGLILFSLTTAFMIEFIVKLRTAQDAI